MCGSKTVHDGICSVCGAKPKLQKEFYSKKEWADMVKRGMVQEEGK